MNQPPTPPTPAAPPPQGGPPGPTPPPDPASIVVDVLFTATAALQATLAGSGSREDLSKLRDELQSAYQKLEPLGAELIAQGAPDPRALALAGTYRARAAQLTKRAGATADAAERAEYERRAAWYVGRAEVKEMGLVIMPHALRTKLEQCEIVNMLRRTLAQTLDGVQLDIAPADVDVFVEGLARGKKTIPLSPEERAGLAPVQTATRGAFDTWAASTWRLLQALGGSRSEDGTWQWATTAIDASEKAWEALQATAPGAVAQGGPVIAPTGTRLGKTPPPASSSSNGGAPE